MEKEVIDEYNFRNIILLLLICIVIVLIIFRKAWVDRFFAWVYIKVFYRDMMVHMMPIKKDFFSTLSEHKSYFEELRKTNVIRILELGPGPGTNFEFYPDKCRVICYDPNPHFATTLDEHRKKYPQVNFERLITAGAENLREVEDESVDIVVSTFVFCSVDNMETVLKEVKRVLVPGGKFYFMDHINSAPGTWNQLLKQIIQPLWKFFMSNCHITRNPTPLIRNFGFAKVEVSNFVITVTKPFNQCINDCVMGTAQK